MINVEYEPVPDVVPEEDADKFIGKGFLKNLFNRSAGLIKAITGNEKWWQRPVMSLRAICATLDNRVYTNPTYLGTVESNERFYSTELPFNDYIFHTSDNKLELPNGYYYLSKRNSLHTDSVTGLINGTVFTATHRNAGTIYTASWQNGCFSGWRKLATAEPPTKHSLVLASGITGDPAYNYYFKTQENIVYLRFVCIKEDATPMSAGERLFSLPVGYRPSTELRSHTDFDFKTGGIHQYGAASILPDGSAHIFPGFGTTSDYIHIAAGEISFLAD